MMIQEVSFQQQVVTFTTQSRPAAPAPARPCADSVSLSPEAQAGTKAETLVAALDADKDGAISDKEFIDGGTALLRPASHRRHSHNNQADNGVHRGWYGSHRLEHRLERVFDRVDANGDGALDAGELTSALSGAAVSREAEPEETTAPPAAETSAEEQIPASTTTAQTTGAASTSPSFTATTFRFTFVSIAVHQYQVSGQEQTPSPPQLQASA